MLAEGKPELWLECPLTGSHQGEDQGMLSGVGRGAVAGPP